MTAKPCKLLATLLMIFLITAIIPSYGSAADQLTIQVNAGEHISAPTLRGGLNNYKYEDITSLTIIRGTVTLDDLSLLQNKTPDESSASFALPSLQSLAIQSEAVLPQVIPSNFMFGHPKLKEVSIESLSPITISARAFAECRELSRVKLSGAAVLENSAFRSCAKLSSIEMKNVNTLGGYVLAGCSSLVSVTLGETIPSSFPDTCFPEHSFTLKIPKGQQATYQSRLHNFPNLIFEEYGEEGTQPSEPQGNVSLSGNAKSSYSVSVTPTISFGDMEKQNGEIRRELRVTAEKLFLEEGQQVKATVSSGADGFTLKTGKHSTVPFRIQSEQGGDIQNQEVFARLNTEGMSASANLVLDQGKLPFAGQYEGALVFEFSLEEAA